MFCDVDPDAVIQNLTARSIYEVPMLMEEQGLDTIVLRKLEMEDKPKDMQGWHDMVARILKKYDKKVTIAVVGKYVALQDAYISITESLRHAAVANETELDIHWVNAEEIEADDTLTSKAYNAELIYERHRHRYEFNNAFREEIVGKGLVLGGTLPNGRLVEIVELPESEHPWFLGAQFHPEFKSRPTNPHPLFREFVGAAVKHH